ncbi:MAG: glucose-1-phosphate thymidylyltransferase RfbA [Nitrospirae bacterium]|nr:glucose-1-phosphate thymidylyltransferase RfbA [Nitrospirota bacterium]MBF0542001.1 glucose-1-phosphate thymidylyltransferase RfbA [Nitrospirota bacterium]
MKGIVLAGGTGSRLYPLTLSLSKQLLPVYDKPMIYYPLTTLMLGGIRDILIITTIHDAPLFRNLLKDGSQWGISISYAEQANPKGIAEAFIIGRSFIGDDSVCLILGDNIFYSEGLTGLMERSSKLLTLQGGAKIFGYYMKNPKQYGVAEIDDNNNILSLEEKPKKPKSNYAVPGLYFYDNQVINIASQIKPSINGEIEITDINKIYLKKKQLSVEILGRGAAWMDAGTHSSLLQAGSFIQTIEERQGLKIGCPEEVAYRKKFITKNQLMDLVKPIKKTAYGRYLLDLINIKSMQS